MHTATAEDFREPWYSFLRELDAAATSQVPFDCFGEFVMTVLYGLARATADVDVLNIVPRDQAGIICELA